MANCRPSFACTFRAQSLVQHPLRQNTPSLRMVAADGGVSLMSILLLASKPIIVSHAITENVTRLSFSPVSIPSSPPELAIFFLNRCFGITAALGFWYRRLALVSRASGHPDSFTGQALDLLSYAVSKQSQEKSALVPRDSDCA